jgi:hypothetical protein
MARMGRPPKDDMEQISLRIARAWIARAVAIATQMSERGFHADRASVLRAAIGQGLEALEGEHISVRLDGPDRDLVSAIARMTRETVGEVLADAIARSGAVGPALRKHFESTMKARTSTARPPATRHLTDHRDDRLVGAMKAPASPPKKAKK